MFKFSFDSESLKIVESLNVDTQLQLSCNNFANELRQHIVVSTNELTSAERLKKIKEFPSAALLSKFAWKVYEEGVDHELPEGWKELTTACNNDFKLNGYYGAAYWHPENHFVVVAHRGTELNNVGAVVADIAGIVFNNCGGQMESACTFTEKVVQSMRSLEQDDQRVHFQLFFTGHSLGGWLAQVTSFSNYFLKRSEDTFVRLTDQDPEPYHALTTVFDSPGCLPMLLKLKSRFAEGKPIHLNNLSITSFLSAPNHINICNPHYGDIFRVFVDTSTMNFLSRNLGYTLQMHSIVNIVDFFEKQQEKDAKEVIEWPTMEGLTNTQELEKFLKYADHRNRYHIDERTLESARKIQIRYKTRNFDPFSCSINVFTEKERQFLECLRWLRQLPEFEALRKYVKEAKLSDEILENSTNFEIVNGRLRVKDSEKLKVFIPHVKLLMKIHPNFAERAKAFLMDKKTRSKIFAYETKVCLNQFVYDFLDFDSTTKVDLEMILQKQFVHITMKNGRAQHGLSMINKLFQKSFLKQNYNDGAVLVLDVKRFSIVNELVSIGNFLDSTGGENFLLMLMADKLENSRSFEKLSMENLFKAMKLHRNFKVIACGEAGDECFEDLEAQAKENLGDEFVETTSIDFSWQQLSKESREKILNKNVNFQGTDVNLKSFFGLKPSLEVNDLALMQLLSEKALNINSDPLKTFDFSVYTSDHEKKEIKPKIFLERLEKSNDLFFISGLYSEDPETLKNDLFKVLKVEDKKDKDLIIKTLSFGGSSIDEDGKKLDIISLVGSDACLKYFDRSCRDLLTKNSRRLIHWIKIKENELTWRKTYNFDAPIDRKLLKNSRPVTREQIYKEKTVAVVGVAGQGKTSFLTQLCKELLKQSWIVHLRMNELSLKSIDQLNDESLANFIAEAANYDSDNHLQAWILRRLLSGDSTCPVLHFLVDGFDELLNEKARSKALKLFAFIKTLPKSKLILVSSHEKIFSELEPAIYTFEKLNRDEKQYLLKQFYIPRFSLLWGSKECEEIFNDKKSNFGGFSKIVLDHLNQLIDENADALMGSPQQLKLIAYGFQDDFTKYVQWKQKIIEVLGVQSFYQQYIKSKYELYVTAKVQVNSIDKKGKSLLNAVQSVTLDSLLPQPIKDLVNRSELFSPDYIVLQLTKGQPPPKVLSTLTGYLLTDPKLSTVRDFLNSHPEYLPRTAAFEISDETIKAITGQPMITAALEKRAKILDFLIEILKKRADLGGVVLQKGKSNKTALEIAIDLGDEVCVKSLAEFLSEFGDRRALLVDLEQNNKNLMKILEKSENRNFVEWIADLITNSKI